MNATECLLSSFFDSNAMMRVCFCTSRRASMTTTKANAAPAFWRVLVSTILASVSRNSSERSTSSRSSYALPFE